jgi:catechol 2,3-dioxygenase-like lactoylglutathione lyase family enzyme
MKLEVVIIPVSNVDRAKEFYAKLGYVLARSSLRPMLQGQLRPPAPATFRNLNDYDVGAMVRHPSVLPSSRAHQNMGTRYGSDRDQGQRRPGGACLTPV